MAVIGGHLGVIENCLIGSAYSEDIVQYESSLSCRQPQGDVESKNKSESVQGIADGEDVTGFFLLRGRVNKFFLSEMTLGVIISEFELGCLGKKE